MNPVTRSRIDRVAPADKAGPWLAALGLLCLLPLLAGLVPTVRFVRERIDVTLAPDEVRVHGVYVYRNPWPIPVVQGLAVPLPVDREHPMPTEVAVARLTPRSEPLATRTVLGALGTELHFGPFEEVQVSVRYRQHAPTREGRYLLTTTRPWHRPLEAATYTLATEGVRLGRSSYPLEHTATGWGFERRDFMPPEDWRFAWEPLPDTTRGGHP
jgi:hypothetical protein